MCWQLKHLTFVALPVGVAAGGRCCASRRYFAPRRIAKSASSSAPVEPSGRIAPSVALLPPARRREAACRRSRRSRRWDTAFELRELWCAILGLNLYPWDMMTEAHGSELQ